MLYVLPPLLRGVTAFALLVLNTLFWVPFLLLFTLLRLVLPFDAAQKGTTRVALFIAENWISCNSGWMRLTQRMDWDVQGVQDLDPRSWYMVCANHQSWVDIFVLQHTLNRRIPLLKFFLKRELIWVPVMGVVWWALEFPFMHRHSEAYLKKHPEMRGKDQEATRRACARFSLVPTSVMNFLEGTRFTPAKHAQQGSPYRHLLKPKAGGLALAFNAMGEKFQALLDVTLAYPDGVPTFWSFLCGRTRRVIVRVRSLPVPPALLKADYAGDPAAREAFQRWVGELWQAKDEQIAALLANAHPVRA